MQIVNSKPQNVLKVATGGGTVGAVYRRRLVCLVLLLDAVRVDSQLHLAGAADYLAACKTLGSWAQFPTL